MRNLASTAIVLGRLVAVNCGILSAVSHPSPEHTLKSTFVLFRVCSGLGWDTAGIFLHAALAAGLIIQDMSTAIQFKVAAGQ